MRIKHIKCTIYILLCLPILIKGQEGRGEEEEDGFHVETVEESEEHHETEKPPTHHGVHHFAIDCPGHYFRCSNGECISPKWRCDNHYDCDDYSDELNCTHKEPNLTNLKFDHLHQTSPDLQSPSHHPLDDISQIQFNSTIEPLMLFSSGLSIRGFWMHSRIYFDVVSLLKRQTMIETPSISQAFSLLFGLSTSSPQARVEEITIKTTSTIVGIDMDPSNKEVFWVELGKEPGVYSILISEDEFDESRMRRESKEQKTIVDTGLISPEDIALDVIGRNIYITDAGLPAIIVCSIKHKYCKTLVEHNLHKPRAIIVDPSTGWLTYTDWGDDPGIFLVSMDGKRREALVNEDIVWPNGIAADYTNDHLFWADARLKRIERIDLKTRLRRVIVREEAGNPFSLSLFENRIYWSDWAGSDIKTCDKFYGNDTRTILHTDNIYGIHIYHPSIYGKVAEQADPCWSKHCTSLCLLAPVSHSFSDRKQGAITGSCIIPLKVSKSKDNNGNHIKNNNSTNSNNVTTSTNGSNASTNTPSSSLATTNSTSSTSSTSTSSSKITNNNNRSNNNNKDNNNAATVEAASHFYSNAPSTQITQSTANNSENINKLLWLIVLIIFLSIVGLVTLSYFYLQGRKVSLDRVQLIN